MPELYIVITSKYGMKARPDDYVLVVGAEGLKGFIGTPNLIYRVEKTKRVKASLTLT